MLRRLRVRRYLARRRRIKDVKPKPSHHVYCVAKTIGGRRFGYWRGVYKGNGFTFTSDHNRAECWKRRELAQLAADNSMLYMHASYEVVKIRK